MLGYAGPFRGGKHEQYEGGVRAPFIVRWPGRVKAGKTDTSSVISGMDWLPTLCKLAGITDLPATLDGEDVSEIWLGDSRQRTKPLFWKTSTPNRSGSMRDGNWKIHVHPRRGKGTELYDLSQDPSERRNLADAMPDVTDRLTNELKAWMASLPKSYEKTSRASKQRKERRRNAKR